jgi:DNA topoisomerase-1
MNLIIVESPTKANTIANFLGPKYRVLSSYGHVRDLPKSELGVDIEKNFQPKYIIPTKAKKTINLLKKELLKADEVILATDEDREGEAISWHLASALGLDGGKKYQRIVFHEITKQAIEEALKNPRKIDLNLVDAQQARRVLDRIVGYKLSPFLWKKVARGLSAGRVQSVAVVLVVDREREIEKFIPQEYWSVEAKLRKEKTEKEFIASLVKKDDKPMDKLEIKNKEEADKIIDELTGAEYRVASIEKKELKRNPLPPFTTSTLQQAAWQKFKFSAKFTMQLAQRLYENGSITYHRTDSLNLSDLSLFAAKNYIEKNYGEKYWAGYLRRFKTKSKRAQEAHEAIRPSYPDKTPSSLLADKKRDKMAEAQLKLYELIWSRFIACQMNQAVFDTTTIDIQAKNYTFRINGQTLKFDGFLKVYPLKFEEAELPALEKEEILELIELLHSQHFTQPPARYNEATLIKALEEKGIGRPSTYAPILSNIQDKNYIEKNDQKRFRPTEIGTVVSDILVAHFPEIVDVNFTAGMEESLDQVAEGKKEWAGVIREFYQPFAQNLEKKYQEVSKKDVTETPTEKTCPKCKSPLLIRLGKYGKFYACSGFPKCRHTESLEENALKIKCPKCKKGKLVEKRTKKRKIFYGCNQFPKCDFALWDKPIEKFCPKCNSILV